MALRAMAIALLAISLARPTIAPGGLSLILLIVLILLLLKVI